MYNKKAISVKENHRNLVLYRCNRMIENHVKKYFNPLKPDSARVVYQILPMQYGDPDTVPNPVKMEVEIKDKDSVLVYGPRDLDSLEMKNQVLFWDGKDNGGSLVDLDQYPFKAELILTYREAKGRQLWNVRRPTLLNPYVVSIVQPEPLDTFWIDATPTMPAVNCEGRVEGIFGDITYYPFMRWFWRLKTVWHPINTIYRFLDSTYTTQPLIGIPIYVCQPERFNGDSVWLKVKIEVPITQTEIHRDSVDEHRGYIRGRNPTWNTINTYFDDDRLRAIGWFESAWKQFLVGNEPYPYPVHRGLPHQGRVNQDDCGIMQLNFPSHITSFPSAGWNWQNNIYVGSNYFATCHRNAESWSKQHPEAVYHNYDPNNNMYDTYDHVLRDAFCRYNSGPTHRRRLYNDDGTIRDQYRWDNYVCPAMEVYLERQWIQ